MSLPTWGTFILILIPLVLILVWSLIPNKKMLISKIIISIITIILIIGLIVFGNVMTYGSGAKINKDKTITITHIISNKDVGYENIKAIGSIRIVKSSSKKVRYKAIVSRNLIKGTTITVSSKSSISDENIK